MGSPAMLNQPVDTYLKANLWAWERLVVARGELLGPPHTRSLGGEQPRRWQNPGPAVASLQDAIWRPPGRPTALSLLVRDRCGCPSRWRGSPLSFGHPLGRLEGGKFGGAWFVTIDRFITVRLVRRHRRQILAPWRGVGAYSTKVLVQVFKGFPGSVRQIIISYTPHSLGER